MSAKGQILRRASQGGYYALPKDFRRPPHLRPQISLQLSLLSAALLIGAIFSVWFLWLAFLPILAAVKGRKDKGVFLYGFFTGFPVASFFFNSLGAAMAGPVISFSLLTGFWLWFSRKIHFYLTFPDARTAIAGVAKERFVLTPLRQTIFCLASSVIFTSAILLFRECALITPSFQEHNLLTKYFGSGSSFFIVIFISCALVSSLEYRMIDDRQKFSTKVPLSAGVFFVCTWLIIGLFPSERSSQLETSPKTVFTEFAAANSLTFIDTVPLQLKFESFNSAPVQPAPVNQIKNLGILPYADAYFPKTVRNLIRDGAKILIAEYGFPGVKEELKKRCLEFGVAGIIQKGTFSILISANGAESSVSGKEFKADIHKTFYSLYPQLFKMIIHSLFCLILLMTSVHLVNRRKTLYFLMVKKII